MPILVRMHHMTTKFSWATPTGTHGEYADKQLANLQKRIWLIEFLHLGLIIGWSRLLSEDLGGKWSGSEYLWGNSRVWLEPSKETNTYGRDDFSIHGGWVPGSAGCVDITSNIVLCFIIL